MASETSHDAGTELRVLTFNVWHGLRAGESTGKFPGEDPERMQRRFDWQIEEIRRLGPDLLFLQEVNPNQKKARRYAEALGYDEIHKVASCGIHLGKLIKIPKNVNDGLAILARPELGLRRVGKKRLSGNAACTATFGFQTKESRYALFGEITVGGRKILVATTHLSSPPFVPEGFENELDRLVSEGAIEAGQREEILELLESRRTRNLYETRKLLDQTDRHRRRLTPSGYPTPAILAGDFNTQPGTPSIAAVEKGGFRNAASGPDYLTWDPVRNRENFGIGSKRSLPLPTFENAEIEEMLERRRTAARQIDYVFLSKELRAVTAEMVMDRERNGVYPSDHFGILVVVDLSEIRSRLPAD
jgi:endonuclease/exonuclease/phosphatase family metal-dependent hydrolase